MADKKSNHETEPQSDDYTTLGEMLAGVFGGIPGVSAIKLSDEDGTVSLTFDTESEQNRFEHDSEGNLSLTVPVSTGDTAFFKGNFHYERGEFEQALACYSRALELQPDDPEILYNRAMALNRYGDPEEALAAYDQAIALKPDDHRYWGNRAGVNWRLDYLEQAFADLARALELSAGEVAHYYQWLGQWRYQLGQYAEAIAAFVQALAREPELESIYFDLAKAHARNGNWAEALHYFDLDIEHDGDAPAVSSLMNRARAHLALSEPALALSDLNWAVELAPEEPQLYRTRAEAQQALGDAQAALTDLDLAGELDPEDAGALLEAGELCASCGAHEMAIERLSAAVERDPQLAAAWFRLAICQFSVGQSDAAIAALSTAITLEPENAIALSNRGFICSEIGHYEQAAADFDAAIAIDPSYAKVYYNRAAMYVATKQWARARADYVHLRDVVGDDVDEFLDGLPKP